MKFNGARFVRACLKHRLALVESIVEREAWPGHTREVLTCPAGAGHEVGVWLVLDNHARRVLAAGTFDHVTLFGVFDPPADFRSQLPLDDETEPVTADPESLELVGQAVDETEPVPVDPVGERSGQVEETDVDEIDEVPA